MAQASGGQPRGAGGPSRPSAPPGRALVVHLEADLADSYKAFAGGLTTLVFTFHTSEAHSGPNWCRIPPGILSQALVTAMAATCGAEQLQPERWAVDVKLPSPAAVAHGSHQVEYRLAAAMPTSDARRVRAAVELPLGGLLSLDISSAAGFEDAQPVHARLHVLGPDGDYHRAHWVHVTVSTAAGPLPANARLAARALEAVEGEGTGLCVCWVGSAALDGPPDAPRPVLAVGHSSTEHACRLPAWAAPQRSSSSMLARVHGASHLYLGSSAKPIVLDLGQATEPGGVQQLTLTLRACQAAPPFLGQGRPAGAPQAWHSSWAGVAAARAGGAAAAAGGSRGAQGGAGVAAARAGGAAAAAGGSRGAEGGAGVAAARAGGAAAAAGGSRGAEGGAGVAASRAGGAAAAAGGSRAAVGGAGGSMAAAGAAGGTGGSRTAARGPGSHAADAAAAASRGASGGAGGSRGAGSRAADPAAAANSMLAGVLRWGAAARADGGGAGGGADGSQGADASDDSGGGSGAGGDVVMAAAPLSGHRRAASRTPSPVRSSSQRGAAVGSAPRRTARVGAGTSGQPFWQSPTGTQPVLALPAPSSDAAGAGEEVGREVACVSP